MEFIEQHERTKNEAKVLNVKEEIPGTKSKMEICWCFELQAEDQSNTSDDKEDRSTADIAKRNLGWRSRSKDVKVEKPKTIKEDYMQILESFQIK